MLEFLLNAKLNFSSGNALCELCKLLHSKLLLAQVPLLPSVCQLREFVRGTADSQKNNSTSTLQPSRLFPAAQTPDYCGALSSHLVTEFSDCC